MRCITLKTYLLKKKIVAICAIRSTEWLLILLYHLHYFKILNIFTLKLMEQQIILEYNKIMITRLSIKYIIL